MASFYKLIQQAKGFARSAKEVSASFGKPATPGNAIIALVVGANRIAEGTFADDYPYHVYWNVINRWNGADSGVQLDYSTVPDEGCKTVRFLSYHDPSDLLLLAFEYTAPPNYVRGNSRTRVSIGRSSNAGEISTKAPDDLVLAFAIDFSGAARNWRLPGDFACRALSSGNGPSVVIADFIAKEIGEYQCEFTGDMGTDSTLAGIAAFGIAFLVLACNSPGPGTVGVAFSQTITASAGTPPYTFSITVGALPAGLSINASTGQISGIPTTPGVSSFTVHGVDSTPILPLAGDVGCSITINPAGSFEISLFGVKRFTKEKEAGCVELPPEKHVKVVM